MVPTPVGSFWSTTMQVLIRPTQSRHFCRNSSGRFSSIQSRPLSLRLRHFWSPKKGSEGQTIHLSIVLYAIALLMCAVEYSCYFTVSNRCFKSVHSLMVHRVSPTKKQAKQYNDFHFSRAVIHSFFSNHSDQNLLHFFLSCWMIIFLGWKVSRALIDNLSYNFNYKNTVLIKLYTAFILSITFENLIQYSTPGVANPRHTTCHLRCR